MRYRTAYPNELCHYGVKGMHWGVRRYQNYDGTRIGASVSINRNSNSKTVPYDQRITPRYHKRPRNERERKENDAYYRYTNKLLVNKQHKKPKTYMAEPEGNSFARQIKEDELKQKVKDAKDFKERRVAEKNLKAHQRETSRKVREYTEYEKQVLKYTGPTKNYIPLVDKGEEFTNDFINKHSGQIITEKEYYDAWGAEYNNTPGPLRMWLRG